MLSVVIDRDKCAKCHSCVDICANSKVIETDDDGYPVYKHIHKCISCGHCAAICPQHAISMRDTRPERENRCVTDELECVRPSRDPDDAVQLVSGTRSTRSFLSKNVENDTIQRVLDAMIRAPSAGNEQNRNYYVFTSRETLRALEADMERANAANVTALSNPLIRAIAMAGMKKHTREVYTENGIELSDGDVARCVGETLDSLSDKRENFFFKDAPVVILVTSDTTRKGMHEKFYKADVEIAVTHGTIVATALGLSSCRLGIAEIFFGRNPALRATYGIPKTERIDEILALGYSDTAWKRIPRRGPAKIIWG